MAYAFGVAFRVLCTPWCRTSAPSTMVIAKAGHIVLCCCRTAREAAAFVPMLATHASGFGRSGATLHRACSASVVLVVLATHAPGFGRSGAALHRACSACVALVVLATHAPGFDRSGAPLYRACSVSLVLVAHLLGHWLHYEGCVGGRHWSWVCVSVLLLQGGNQARLNTPSAWRFGVITAVRRQGALCGPSRVTRWSLASGWCWRAAATSPLPPCVWGFGHLGEYTMPVTRGPRQRPYRPCIHAVETAAAR